MNVKTDATIPHFVRSYANVQEVIRFMDAKAGVIFTLAGVMIGVLAAKPIEWCDWARFGIGAGVTCSFLAMLCALRVVWPSHGPKKPEQLTLLFPALHPNTQGENGNKPDIYSLIRMKVETLSPAAVADEYGIQLAYLHIPIVRKIRALRAAIISISAALLCIGVAQFGKKTIAEPIPPIHVNLNLTTETLQKANQEFQRQTHDEGKVSSGGVGSIKPTSKK